MQSPAHVNTGPEKRPPLLVPPLRSGLDARSPEFDENRSVMLERLDEIDDLLAEAAAGGGPESMARLAKRGKLPVRERIALALDPDSPFLEISGLAAYDSDYKIGGGAVVGWVGVDQYDERNTVLSDMLQRYREKHDGAELRPKSATSVGYDIGRTLALGLSRMRIASPWALKDALETIRREPATTGAPETVITFGPQDHRGFKGANFLVLRRATGGKSEFVGTAAV